jgi:hypothetical protein
MKNRKKLEGRILARIRRKKNNLIMREDFVDLGGYDQVGRALAQLASKNVIVKVGYGLYAKARVSSLTGEVMPVESLPAIAREAMKRLGVRIVPTKMELDYLNGRSTQVPTGRLIGVKDRISRKIGYRGASINYERIS